MYETYVPHDVCTLASCFNIFKVMKISIHEGYKCQLAVSYYQPVSFIVCTYACNHG